tara:strand:+ start:195 stop:560 length:366 start_codon:yes stop_codon:yes gene_type:complete
MANTLRYTYQLVGATWNGSEMENGPITFDDVDSAKGMLDFSECDFTGLSPVYSLEDSDTTLVVTIPFADSDAGRTAQDAFHNNMKDTWTVTGSTDGSTPTEVLQPDNSFTVTSIKDGEVDI